MHNCQTPMVITEVSVTSGSGDYHCLKDGGLSFEEILPCSSILVGGLRSGGVEASTHQDTSPCTLLYPKGKDAFSNTSEGILGVGNSSGKTPLACHTTASLKVLPLSKLPLQIVIQGSAFGST